MDGRRFVEGLYPWLHLSVNKRQKTCSNKGARHDVFCGQTFEVWQPLQSSQVKRTLQDPINGFIFQKLKPFVVVNFRFMWSYSQGRSCLPSKIYENESVTRFRNWCQLQMSFPACVMSSEYFTRTSLYLVRLKIFERIKFLRRHLHEIQGNWGGRTFVTESRVNSRLITHARMPRWIWNLQLPTDLTWDQAQC